MSHFMVIFVFYITLIIMRFQCDYKKLFVIFSRGYIFLSFIYIIILNPFFMNSMNLIALTGSLICFIIILVIHAIGVLSIYYLTQLPEKI